MAEIQEYSSFWKPIFNDLWNYLSCFSQHALDHDALNLVQFINYNAEAEQ